MDVAGKLDSGLEDVPSDAVDQLRDIIDPDAVGVTQRFYRIMTPAQP